MPANAQHMAFDASELRKFTAAGEAIAKAAQATIEDWAVGEIGIIGKGTAALIRAQTVPAAEKRARNRVLNKLGLTKGAETINSGVRGAEGRVWVRTKRGKWQLAGIVGHNAGPFIPRNRRLGAGEWGAAKDSVTAYQGQSGVIALAKRTVGLARQSVIQMLDAVGIAIERVAGGTGLTPGEIAAARGAVASDGKTYQNGTGRREKTATGFSIEIVNTYPNLAKAKIDVALATVVGQRIAYQGRVLNDKLLASTERVAQAFPYLQVGR